MEKIIYDNNVSTFTDDTQINVVDAAGTSASGATGLFVPGNFKRVIFLVNRVDDSNYAVGFLSIAVPGQEVEIHPIGGSIEVFATKIPTYNQNFLDGNQSFVTSEGSGLRGVPNPFGLNAWSRLS